MRKIIPFVIPALLSQIPHKQRDFQHFRLPPLFSHRDPLGVKTTLLGFYVFTEVFLFCGILIGKTFGYFFMMKQREK